MKLKLYSLIMFLMLITTNLYAFPIPDTGITKCYDDTKEIPCPTAGQDFYGQDGNYSINPMSYTKLDATGNALPVTATTWAMVKDNVTGLIWENNSHESTWDNAPTVIASLNTAKFGGYSDWRLPTMTELGSIVDFSVPYPGPTINTTYFKDAFASVYWSNSTNAYNGVSFDNGCDGGDSDTYVRAVRGGQSVVGSFDPLVINRDGTISDTVTGLMWQQDTAKTAAGETTMVWKDALSYCENLNLGGYTDWRLPTVKELRSIVDFSVPYPGHTINTNYFKDTLTSAYWSSSPCAGFLQYVWLVGFEGGNSSVGYMYDYFHVRAVRAGQAENDPTLPTLALSSSSGAAGTTATVNLTLTNVTGTNIAAISTDIDFDDSILENPTAVIGAAGTAAGKETLTVDMVDSSTVRIALFSLSSTKAIGNGIAASITFKIKSTAANGSLSTLTQTANGSDQNGNPVAINGTQGKITVSNCKLGDCNCNGVVTIDEVQSAINMLLGLKTVQPCCDRDENGAVSIAEVQTIINNFRGIEVKSTVDKNEFADEAITRQADFTNQDAFTRESALIPTLTLESKSASAGDTIKLALTLANQGAEIISLSTNIIYDTALFESAAAEIGEAGTNAGKTIFSNDAGGKLVVGLISMTSSNIINDGVVAYITLKAKADAVGTASINNTASGSDKSGTAVEITGNTAQITFDSSGQEQSYEILTPQSPDITIYNGESVKVFGCAGVNTVNLIAGGKAECINFIGENVVNIEDSASGFTVRRSGATVYLENSATGTFIKIPATKTIQTINFAVGVKYNLVISNDGKVMLGSRVVGLTELQL